MPSSAPTSHAERLVTLRLIAFFEAVKGLAALVAASGLLVLTPDDVQDVAGRIVDHLHLDPASHYPSVFLNVASKATPQWLRLVAVGAIVYGGIRFAEAIGLWRDKSWAEWLGVVTGLIYVPFEAYALMHRPGPEPLLALLVNVGIVLFLGERLRRRGKMRLIADTVHRYTK
jgi:uncharacterized membrane protein (DUF2068 family)